MGGHYADDLAANVRLVKEQSGHKMTIIFEYLNLTFKFNMQEVLARVQITNEIRVFK